jgi:hypothetical protein
VGWSDHSVRPGVVARAVHGFGASMVEFHLDLDGQGEEFKAGHCWLPEPMAQVIAHVRESACADGTGEKLGTWGEQARRAYNRPVKANPPMIPTRPAVPSSEEAEFPPTPPRTRSEPRTMRNSVSWALTLTNPPNSRISQGWAG